MVGSGSHETCRNYHPHSMNGRRAPAPRHQPLVGIGADSNSRREGTVIYLHGMNTGCVAVVRDAETRETRYAKDKSEIANWPEQVEVNGAHIRAKTVDGRWVDIRGNHIRPGDVGDNWYDADHAAFMKHLQEAERHLRNMLGKAGLQVRITPINNVTVDEVREVISTLDIDQTVELVGEIMVHRVEANRYYVNDTYSYSLEQAVEDVMRII